MLAGDEQESAWTNKWAVQVSVEQQQVLLVMDAEAAGEFEVERERDNE